MENDLNKTQEVSLDEGVNELSYIKDSLEKMAYWGRFLGVLGYIACGIGSLTFIYACIEGNMSYMLANTPGVVGGWIIALIIYYFTAKYLCDFSKEAYVFVKHDLVRNLGDGLSNLAAVFKLYGVIAIIYLVLMLLSFLAFMFA